MPPIYIWICEFESSINAEVAKTKETNVVSKISLIFSPP